jgi:hypothetical protein
MNLLDRPSVSCEQARASAQAALEFDRRILSGDTAASA